MTYTEPNTQTVTIININGKGNDYLYADACTHRQTDRQINAHPGKHTHIKFIYKINKHKILNISK